MEAFTIGKRHRIPLGPVRDVDEAMRDRHMHERGMLEWIEPHGTSPWAEGPREHEDARIAGESTVLGRAPALG